MNWEENSFHLLASNLHVFVACLISDFRCNAATAIGKEVQQLLAQCAECKQQLRCQFARKPQHFLCWCPGGKKRTPIGDGLPRSWLQIMYLSYGDGRQNFKKATRVQSLRTCQVCLLIGLEVSTTSPTGGRPLSATRCTRPRPKPRAMLRCYILARCR